MTITAPLASGREADVFAIDEHRVMRRYRHGRKVDNEVAVMAHVGALAYPVPKVYEAEGAEMVMERLNGPTMLQAFGIGEMDLLEGGQLLAELHTRLHALPARLSADSDVRILHRDLHPDNIMLTVRGPVVIDWGNATEGPPDLDLAVSALILAEVAADAAHPLSGAAQILMTGFLGHAGGDPLRMLDRAVAMRSANPTLTAAEIGNLDAAATLIRDALD